MVRALFSKKSIVGACALSLLFMSAACGDVESPRVSVRLFTWTEDGGFVKGLEDNLFAQEVRVRVTKPDERLILSEEGFLAFDKSASLPEVEQGAGLRMEFDVHDGLAIVATGSTPIFSMSEAGRSRAFRTMLSPVNAFAPVGSMVRSPQTGEEKLVNSRLDGRAMAPPDEETPLDLGRVGHTAHLTESGEVLIVGGGQVGALHKPATKPQLSLTFNDIQLFDPATGYFTELAGDEKAIRAGMVGKDRLEESRAFHSVTALGQDRFLVVGGYTILGGTVTPTHTIELIDLKAAPGARVQKLYSGEGTRVRLLEPRGMHTATRRSFDGAVVIAGGLGGMNGDSASSRVEVIYPDLQPPRIESGVQMQAARVGHSAVLMDDGFSVWLIGGRNENGVLSSTEIIASGDLGTVSTPAGNLSTARYGAAVETVQEGGENYILVAGGFRGTDGSTTSSYELGRQSLGDFTSDSGWELKISRGGAQIYKLPQSRDLVVLGGYLDGGGVAAGVERLKYQGSDRGARFTIDDRIRSMYVQRGEFAGVGLNNGRYLLVGGFDPDFNLGRVRADADYLNVYDPVIPRRR